MPKFPMPWRRPGMPDRLTPRVLLSLLKLPRNILVSRLYNRRRSAGLAAFRAELGDVSDQSLLCVVAFNLPWAIDLMIRACRRHLPDWRLVVFDNSNRPEAREEIRGLCRAAGVPYLSLPRNPEWSPNRSHGLALNWIHANVLSAAAPAHFGFVDHDCFPFAAAPLKQRIAGQAAYGIRRHSRLVPEAWNHWAGYMFFNPGLVGGHRLDFNHDQIRVLDTAGRNWVNFYRHLDEASLAKADVGERQIVSADGRHSYRVQCIDGAFLHIGGASYRNYGDGAEDYVPSVRAFVEASLVVPASSL